MSLQNISAEDWIDVSKSDGNYKIYRYDKNDFYNCLICQEKEMWYWEIWCVRTANMVDNGKTTSLEKAMEEVDNSDIWN